jgi:uncharacterized membrane protein YidH (DUF202 family)
VSGFPDRAGLQPERTALAWQRTAITALVLLVPMVVVALRVAQPVLAIAGAVAAAASSVLAWSVRRRFTQLHDDERGYPPFVPMVQVGVVTVLGALGGAAVGVAVAVR